MTQDTNQSNVNNLTEPHLLKLWKVDTGFSPKVSVIIHTENTGTQTEAMLQTVLSQQTSFPFEVIIHDNGSTDQTQDIIRQYQQEFPNIIRSTFLQPTTHNQPAKMYTYPAAAGEYIALYEPGSVWLSQEKLAKQVEALDKHPELNFCFHPSLIPNAPEAQDAPPQFLGDYGDEVKVINVNEPTAHSHCGPFSFMGSYLLRTKAIKQLPSWFFQEILIPDSYFHEVLFGKNGLLYLPEALTAQPFIQQEFTTTEFEQFGAERMEQECMHRIELIGRLKKLGGYSEAAIRKSLANIKNRFLIYNNLTNSQAINHKIKTQKHRRINGLPAAKLQKKHMQNCSLLLNRDELLQHIKKNGIASEIGVDTGTFTQKILSFTNPKKLYLIDTWGTERYNNQKYLNVKEKFNQQINLGQVSINRKLSIEAAQDYPDHYFDWIYIDTDHSYKTTWQELQKYSGKVKKDGMILGHDYSMGNWAKHYKYGVIEAVHQFCLEYNWELVFLTVDFTESQSFAIRRIDSL